MRTFRMTGYRPLSKGKSLLVGTVLMVAIAGTSLQGALPASAAAPDAPVIISATAGDGQVVLDWSAPSADDGTALTGYNILQGTTSMEDSSVALGLGTGAVTYTATGLADGTTYYFEVEAVYTDNAVADSDELSATPEAPTATDDYSYNAEGGTPTPSSSSGLNGTSIVLASAPTYAGHTFTGWSDATATYAAGATYVLESNGAAIVFSAQWTTNATVTITFNSELGTAVAAMSGPTGSAITLPTPTYAGYVFDGWFAAASGGTAVASSYTLTTSLTLYAQWTANAAVTITFNSELGSAVAAMSGPTGSAITLPAAPTYAGYVFDGWFAAATGGTALTSPYTLTATLTLYAQWTANAAVTITFNSELGTAVAAMSGPTGSTITLPAAPTYAGYVFDGWFAAATGGTALTSPYTLTASLTLYAQWTANAAVTITFDADGGSAVAAMSGPTGSAITLPAAPTYAGYVFDGWFAAATGGTVLTSPYTLTATLTLYAQWTANATATITFDADGGSAVGSLSGLEGTTITLPAAPIYAGYTFAGWFLAATGGTALTSPYTLTASLTLYAQWTANGTVTITFDADGGSAVGSLSGLDGTTITLPAAPTYPGFTFDGWFLATSGGTALTSPYALSTSLTLYAQWTTNATVTISFDSDGGTSVASVNGPQGSTITLPAAPNYGGIIFEGWFLSASGGTALTSPYTLTTSLTLYAQWSEVGAGGGGGGIPTVTITFNPEGGSAVAVMSGPQASTITLPGAPTYAGFTFDGWFLATSGGAALTSPYTLTNSLTVYAKWTTNESVTITFDAEGGAAVASISGPQGSTINLPGAPVYAGITFNGWFAADSGGTALSSPYTLSTSHTLYAQWTTNVSITNLPSAARFGGQFTPSFKTSGIGADFSVTSTTHLVCSASGTTVTFTGVGTCTLVAHVAASGRSGAGTGATQSFVVGRATATLSITNMPLSANKGGHYTPNLKTSEDGAVVSLTSFTQSVCTVSGRTVNFVAVGTCDLDTTVKATAKFLAVSVRSTISVIAIHVKANTRISLVLSKATVLYGAEGAVTFVIHVTASGSKHALSGVVRITAGGQLLCDAKVGAHGTASCTLRADALNVGAHNISASFVSNSLYNKSTSGEVKLVVVQTDVFPPIP